MTIGEVVKEHRADSHLSFRAAAEEIGIAVGTLYHIENSGDIAMTTFKKLSNWLRLTDDEILFFLRSI